MSLSHLFHFSTRQSRSIAVVALVASTMSAVLLGVATPAAQAAPSHGATHAPLSLTAPTPTGAPSALSRSTSRLAAAAAAEAAGKSGFSQTAEINGASGALYGWSVATSGDTMVVGAPSDNSNIGAVYVYTGSGSTWTPEATLTPADGVSGDFFGGAVAMNGTTIVVGAWGRGNYEGAAYVYAYSGSGVTFTDSQQAELTDPGLVSNDLFSASVAIAGNSIAVGAPGENSNTGATYVYALHSGTWSLASTLSDPGAVANDSFGYSVAFQSSTLAIGAPGVSGTLPSNTGQAFTGAAYVFKRTGGISGTWTQQAELTASNGRGCVTTCSNAYGLIYGDYFGYSVALKGKTVVVGAPFSSLPTPAPDSAGNGSAYAFTESANVWSQKDELYDPAEDTNGPAAGDSFGYAVAFLGKAIVANAPGDPQGFQSNSATGATFVFAGHKGVWATYPTELTAGDGGPGDYFGYGLATVSNKYVVVGAPYSYTPPTYAQDGGVYFFKD